MTFLVNLLKVILYGFLQGFTDFIPINRNGHFILFDSIWSIYPASFYEVFKCVIRIGSLLAVGMIYRNKLNVLDKNKRKSDRVKVIRLWLKLFVGTLPILVVGFILKELINNRLNLKFVIAFATFITGFVLYRVDSHGIKKSTQASFKKIFKIGIFQCISLVPGFSSSSWRTIALLKSGCSRQVAAEYNLLLGIPIVFIEALVNIVQYFINYGVFTFSQIIYVLLGIFVSFVVSYVLIRYFLDYIKKYSYKIFGFYQMILGVFILIYFYAL